MSNKHVWDIVTRWQGLALLYDIYTISSVQEEFRETDPSAFEPYGWEEPESPPEPWDDFFVENTLDVPAEFSKHFTCCDTPEKRDSGVYERFYMAITACWLSIESRRYAQICRDNLQSEKLALWDKHYDRLSFNRGLHEAFNIIEAYDFVYGFLLRHIHPARIDAYRDWKSEDEPNPSDEWQESLDDIRLELSPPDIVELLLLTSNWRGEFGKRNEWPRSRKNEYLRHRMVYDSYFNPHAAKRDIQKMHSYAYSVNDLECVFESKLEEALDILVNKCHRVWTNYRINEWKDDARGTAPSWATSDSDIIHHFRVRISSPEVFKLN